MPDSYIGEVKDSKQTLWISDAKSIAGIKQFQCKIAFSVSDDSYWLILDQNAVQLPSAIGTFLSKNLE